MLITTPETLEERRRQLEHSPTLRKLATRLEGFLDPIMEGSLSLPQTKPMLSRDGGVCPDDGSRLVFDPLSPEIHRCPRCGREVQGDRHHRAWLWRYHLWLSERAVHLAMLAALTGDARLAGRSKDVLDAYVELYPQVPNQDNVLGPTRLFFSTYLESIWLTQIVIAASLLECSGNGYPRAALAAVVRESADLIASFDEGWSNRQVWNNTALIAAGCWLGARPLLARGLDGPHGIRAQLTTAVTSDGLWFEGENYHFFALRGFLLAAELLRTDGLNLYSEAAAGRALTAMYVAPLDTVLPDLTLPARSDAPYGVSVLQPRFAELWEIGRSRTNDSRLESFLAHLYSVNVPEREDPGLEEIAEQEQNRPPARLSRDRLGWKALLMMVPEPPRNASDEWRPGSTLLRDTGLAILRPQWPVCVSVECGGPHGGHGHPDLLHLTLFWDRPLLADYGTGSYVAPSLHWYRSTLAHNAPGLAGLGQVSRQGWCAAFDEQDGWAWCRAVARDVFGRGSSAVRTVMVSPNYVVDVVEVEVPDEVAIDLPIHPVGGVSIPAAPAASPASPAHGYGHLYDIRALPKTPARISTPAGHFRLFLVPRPGETALVATAPGPPNAQFADGPPCSFLVRRASGSGRWIQVYAPASVAAVTVEEDGDTITVHMEDGATECVAWDAERLYIRDRTGAERTLTGSLVAPPLAEVSHRRPPPTITCPLVERLPSVDEWRRVIPFDAVTELGAHHYRRSEQPYEEGPPFAAHIAVFAVGSTVAFAADVTKRPICMRAADTPDPVLDNEPADIHSDGMQCYLGVDRWAGYLLVPDRSSDRVRVRPVAGTAGDERLATGRWTTTDHGYTMIVTVETGRLLEAGQTFPVNVVINQMTPGRDRRAGQLVLSGDAGWVYLRGDRDDPSHAVIAEVV